MLSSSLRLAVPEEERSFEAQAERPAGRFVTLLPLGAGGTGSDRMLSEGVMSPPEFGAGVGLIVGPEPNVPGIGAPNP